MVSIPYLDSLLTLPLVGYFLFPSMTASLGTGLNLLFFSITWTTIVWSYPPLAIEFFSTLVISILFYLIPSTLFLLFDISIPSLCESSKSHGTLAAPPRCCGLSSSSSLTAQRYRLARIVLLSTLNTLLSAILQITLEALFTSTPLPIKSALRISSGLPAPWSLAKDITRGMMLRGAISYAVHRYLLHSAQSSSPIATLTKLHRSFAHSLKHPMPFSSAYDHPVPHLLHRFLPMYLPALLFRFHILTYLVYLMLVSLDDALTYSGYAVLPSTILLSGMARRHETHYMNGGDGNYGVFGVLDFMLGTSVGEGDVMDDVMAEGKKRDVGGKAQRASDRMQEALGDGEDDDDYEDNGADGAEGNGSIAKSFKKATRRSKK